MHSKEKMTRHPFLEDLAEDVVLTTIILTEERRGRAEVLQVIKAAGSLYAAKGPSAPVRLPDGRMLIESTATLQGGRKLQAVVVAGWSGDEVTLLSILFAPLGSALAFALRLGEVLPSAPL